MLIGKLGRKNKVWGKLKRRKIERTLERLGWKLRSISMSGEVKEEQGRNKGWTIKRSGDKEKVRTIRGQRETKSEEHGED